MMSVIREHKWLVVLMVLSVSVIGVGIFMIHLANNKQQSEQAQLHELNEMAKQAAAELEKTVAYPDVPIPDVIPAESVAKVEAMNGQIPEAGSEDWCELMMTKESKEWTQDEQSQFAQHCI